MEMTSALLILAVTGGKPPAKDTISILTQKAGAAEKAFAYNDALLYYTQAGFSLREAARPDSGAKLLSSFGERASKVGEFVVSALAFSGAGMILIESDTTGAVELFRRSGELYERARDYKGAVYSYIEASFLMAQSGKTDQAYEMWKAFAKRAESGGDARSAAIGYASARQPGLRTWTGLRRPLSFK